MWGENCPVPGEGPSSTEARQHFFNSMASTLNLPGGPHPFIPRCEDEKMENLPEDPFEGVRSSSFLRLSNDCPKEGVVVQFLSFPPKIVENKTFGDKSEYHWDVAEVSWNGGFQKTLVESSNGFRASLKAACNGTPPTQRFFMIRWKKENISKGRQQKVWTIKEMNSDEANAWANTPSA